MTKFGSQTSTYNRLVTVFVAIGSMVSLQKVFSHLDKRPNILFMTRPMATVLPSSVVLSVSQDGILTLTCLQRESLATLQLPHPPSRRQMVSLVVVVRSALSS
jgi:hypothetical protein